jgi:hypothetical protein
MSDSTRERLAHAIAQAPSLTRSQLQKRAWIAYGVAIAAMLAVFAAVGGIDHSAIRPASSTARITLGLLVLAALSTAVISKRASSPLGHSGALLAALFGCIPCVVLAWLVLRQQRAVPAEIPVGFRCLALTMVLGGMLLAAMTYARRASDPVHPGWLGAALGAVSAAWAAILVAAWCPLYDLSHTLLGHVAPVLLLAAAGAVLAARALRL